MFAIQLTRESDKKVLYYVGHDCQRVPIWFEEKEGCYSYQTEEKARLIKRAFLKDHPAVSIIKV